MAVASGPTTAIAPQCAESESHSLHEPIDHRTFVAVVRTVALRVGGEYTLEFRGGDQVDVLSCSEITR
jgi:hypothetical protein